MNMDNIDQKEQYPVAPRPNSPVFYDEKTPVKDGDAALDFLRGEAVPGEAETIDERKLVRKIDWMVVPLMFACYLLQFLDKSLLNYAAVMGIREDLVSLRKEHAKRTLGANILRTSTQTSMPICPYCSMSPSSSSSCLMHT